MYALRRVLLVLGLFVLALGVPAAAFASLEDAPASGEAALEMSPDPDSMRADGELDVPGWAPFSDRNTTMHPHTQKVTICKATASQSAPYHLYTADAPGIVNGHLGASGLTGKNIVPPFHYKGKTYFQNWDEVGRAVWKNDCKVKGGPVVPGDGNGLGSELVIFGSLPIAVLALFVAYRRGGNRWSFTR